MRPSTPVPITALLVALLAAVPLSAADLHVDATSGDDARDGLAWAASVRTIGRALVLARNASGPDTIHVAAGTYRENVLVDLSDVTLLGGYPQGGGARNPAANVTTLDGGAAGPALAISGANGTVVLTAVAVDGFTLTNGRSLQRLGAPFGGAGVFVEEAAVTLTNNVIRGNVADGAGARGGGLYVYRLAAGAFVARGNRFESNRVDDGNGGAAWIVDSGDPAALGALVFAQNVVTGNSAHALTDLDPASTSELNGNGGGVFAWGGATVVDGNTVEGNTAEAVHDHDFNGQGGGLFFIDGSPAVTNNVVRDNLALAAGGAYGAAGGGAYVLSAGGSFTGNTFERNEVRGGDGPSQAWGGGLNVTLIAAADPVLSNNTIRENLCTGGGADSGRGGGVYAWVDSGAGATARFTGGTLEGNRTFYAGGGAWLRTLDRAAVTLDGALVRANEADFASGVMAFGDMELRNLRIRENLLYDPDGDEVSEIRDNCPGLANGVQGDADSDGEGDDCDTDDDGDGVADATDNCDLVDNPGQSDGNGNGVGDACDGDLDGDTVADAVDNCRLVANLDQSDATRDGVGDACEPARFDPLETNASGIWLVGSSYLTNAEVVDNVGQGVQVVGFAADPVGGTPEIHSAPVITNATIAGNAAVGFITYLATGTTWRDTIISGNAWSDGFDTQDAGGNPSSPGMNCTNVNFGDGVASLPCAGGGNFTSSPRFTPGPWGNYYLSQTAAGQALDSASVDAGSRLASASPVAGLTTRTDNVADAGQVDLGFHYPTGALPPGPGNDPLGASVRVGRAGAGGAPTVTLSGAPASVTGARWYRGDLVLLRTEYSHQSPFSGQPGTPECSLAPGATFTDTNALTDGRDWYYLAVPWDGSAEGSFGTDTYGVARPRPADSATDLVTNACP